MNKRKLRNAGSRPKALLGLGESGAILAAAGINVAGTMAASAISANATKKAAQDQANATIRSAQRQAQAIKDQSDKAKEYQQEAQDFIREQNAENRELQKDIQMQLQMLAGQQNVNDRLEASKLKVKAGGSIKRRLRSAGGQQFLLRGGNMPFQVTDGGVVLPVGITPEGYDLYEIFGNDHEHYHKTRGGKYKSGVGIKFADGNVVEGEGNQKKNGGELMLVTPDNAYFISKHSINGFNPAEGVKQGLHPLQAYAIQEQEKDMIGLNDDGTKKAKLGKRKFLIGGTPTLYDYTNMGYPQIGTDTIGDTVVGVAYGVQNPTEKRSLRCGGSTRRKAALGDVFRLNNLDYGDRSWITGFNPNKPAIVNNGKPVSTTQLSTTPTTRGSSFSNWFNRNADLAGSFLSGGFNILGAALSASNARNIANIVADAQRTGAGIMRDAYNSLPTIDMNSIRREDYDAPNMMPALRAVVSHAAQPLAQVDRRLQRTLANASRYSTSSAAAQSIMSKGEVDAQDARNQIYNADEQQKQDTINKNIDSINEANKVNVMNKANANLRYAADYLNLLKYKNDTKITKILGSAGATTEGLINSANTIAQGRNAASQSWVNAFSNIGSTVSNTLSSMAKRRADFENTMLGATTDAQINMIARNGTRREKLARLEAVRAAINSGRLSSEDEAKYRYYEELLYKSV